MTKAERLTIPRGLWTAQLINKSSARSRSRRGLVRTAVDEEQVVELGSTRGQGSVRRLIVDSHDPILAARPKRISPFSDNEIFLPAAHKSEVW